MPHPLALKLDGRFVEPTFFIMLAAYLLTLTMAWYVPMMLWDHFDLAPIYQAWNDGDLARSGFWNIHGGHLHTAAYAVLLFTTKLSAGDPWLDCLVSWILLLGYAGIVMLFVRDSIVRGAHAGRAFSFLIIFFALYPGHLANLQWGWQVAVFLCLLGAVVTLFALTRVILSWWYLGLAMAASALAFFSFATSIALVPTALVLIALRADLSISKRIMFAFPWLAAGVAIALDYPAASASNAPFNLVTILAYILNFLGAGLGRFASGISLPLAIAGVASGTWAFMRVRFRRDSLPWLGLVLFAAFASILAAIGRAGVYGSEQAFVTRYISFSSMFWLGWAGLMACAWQTFPRVPVTARAGVALVALLAFINALHMTKKASEVGMRTRVVAQTIRDSYPNVDRKLLADIYYGDPDKALHSIEMLNKFGFAPFRNMTPSH